MKTRYRVIKTIKKRKNNDGFTLIEIVVVLMILAILAAVAVPTMAGYIGDTKAKVCAVNRESLQRYFAYYRTLHTQITLESFLAGEAEHVDDISTFNCPESGVYSVENGAIACSVHSGAGGEGGDDGNDGDGGDPSGSYNIGDTAFTDSNGRRVLLSGNWTEDKAYAAGNYGKKLADGTVYQDDTGVYVVIRNPYLSQESGAQDITLAEMLNRTNGLLRVNTAAAALTDSDHNGEYWTTEPAVGSLYYSNGNLYICGYPSGKWTSTNPGNSVWIQLKGQSGL